jgi:hypothetical protein
VFKNPNLDLPGGFMVRRAVETDFSHPSDCGKVLIEEINFPETLCRELRVQAQRRLDQVSVAG